MIYLEKPTNYDIYKGIIKKFNDEGKTFGLINGTPVRCCDMQCSDCDIHSIENRCQIGILKWLYDEFNQEIVDWSTVKIDTKVLVSNNGEIWFRKHFAGYEDGKIYVWNGGYTSWSILDTTDKVDGKHSWKYTILC